MRVRAWVQRQQERDARGDSGEGGWCLSLPREVVALTEATRARMLIADGALGLRGIVRRSRLGVVKVVDRRLAVVGVMLETMRTAEVPISTIALMVGVKVMLEARAPVCMSIRLSTAEAVGPTKSYTHLCRRRR